MSTPVGNKRIKESKVQFSFAHLDLAYRLLGTLLKTKNHMTQRLEGLIQANEKIPEEEENTIIINIRQLRDPANLLAGSYQRALITPSSAMQVHFSKS